MAFRIGDEVQITAWHGKDSYGLQWMGMKSRIRGHVTHNSNGPGYYLELPTPNAYWRDDELRLVTKGEDNMSDSTENVAQKLELLGLDEPERLLRKYGILNEQGHLTDEGTKVLWRHLFKANKTAVVAELQKLEADVNRSEE